jgi:hypothetical protein
MRKSNSEVRSLTKEMSLRNLLQTPARLRPSQIEIQMTIHRKHSKHTRFVQDGCCTPVAVFHSILTEGEIGNC